MRTCHPSRLVCSLQRPHQVVHPTPSGTKPTRLDPLQVHCDIRLGSYLPKTCFALEKRQMSSLPPTMPPVIHHTEKQEFTITIPGHQSAYLRYSRSSPNRCVTAEALGKCENWCTHSQTCSVIMYTTVVSKYFIYGINRSRFKNWIFILWWLRLSKHFWTWSLVKFNFLFFIMSDNLKYS